MNEVAPYKAKPPAPADLPSAVDLAVFHDDATALWAAWQDRSIRPFTVTEDQLDTLAAMLWELADLTCPKAALAGCVRDFAAAIKFSKADDREAWVRVLAEEIAARRFRFLAVYGGLRRMRTVIEFKPVIADVLKGIEQQDRIWREVRYIVSRCIEKLDAAESPAVLIEYDDPPEDW